MSVPSVASPLITPRTGSAHPSLATEAFILSAKPKHLTYVDLSDTVIHRTPAPGLDGIFNKIVTPYNVDAFQRYLADFHLLNLFPFVTKHLRNGYPLGRMPELRSTVIFPNHPSCLLHWDAVDAYINGEIAAGRMDGPFDRETVEAIMGGPIFVSPLIAAVSSQEPGTPDKIRICRHLSKSTKDIPSVNSYVDKLDNPTLFDTANRVADVVSLFSQAYALCHLPYALCPMPYALCPLPYALMPPLPMLIPLSQISLAPPGTQGCTFDIAKFHRTCPAHPSHKPWLVVQGQDGEFFVDHCVPFGTSSASSIAGSVANAVVDIWQACGVEPTLKYEDDLIAFRVRLLSPADNLSPFDGYGYDSTEAARRIAPLNVPWQWEKMDGVFSANVTYIGFEWDIDSKTVRLPEKKRLKFRERVRRFLDSFEGMKKCTLLDVQKLHGSLCHVAFVYVEGKPRLATLSNLATKFNGCLYSRRFLPDPLVNDLFWWLDILSSPSVCRSIRFRGTPDDSFAIYVDAASKFGIGISIQGKWAAYRLLPGWDLPGRGICWLETIAVELAVYFLEAMGVTGRHLLFHSDNKGTVGILAKGRCANHHINGSVRRTYDKLLQLSITHSLDYVESAANPADPISRLDNLPPSSLHIGLQPPLPPVLSSCLNYVPV
jgi:hypothetical protein